MQGMKYGYARVSTEDQDGALQQAALKRAKCTLILEDKLSGAATKRTALARCLKALQSGDTLIVWKLDRLGRSLRDLIAMLDDLKTARREICVADRSNRHDLAYWTHDDADGWLLC